MSGHEHERLSAYLDGELVPEEMAAVAAHVSACPECAARLAELGAMDEAAAALPAEAPAGYFDTLPARVRARLQTRSAARRLPAWSWAAAAALLLAVITPLTLLRRPAFESSRSAGEIPAAAPLARASAPVPAEAPKAASESSPKKHEFAAAPPEADVRPPSEPTGPREARVPAPVTARLGTLEPAAPARDEARTAMASEEAAGAVPLGSREQRQAEAVRDDDAPRAAADATAEAEAPAQAEAAARGPVAAPARGTLVTQSAPGSEAEWSRLVAVRPATAAEWRRLREEWRLFAAAATAGPHADEARVLTIQAGYEAWRAGGDPLDEALFRRDAAAYLERKDAKQRPRVRGLLR